MFKFFKERINSVINKFKEEHEGEDENPHEEDASEERAVFEEKAVSDENKEKADSALNKEISEKQEKKVRLSRDAFEDMFFDMEMALLENNVAVDVVDRIKEDVYNSLKDLHKRKAASELEKALKSAIEDVLDFETVNLIEMADSKKPFKVMFVGINGSGKTTTIAKIARKFQEKNKTVVLVASDTFRAAAIQQLEHHAEALKVKMIKHDYGADPAAVAFDAVKYAEAHDVDVVLVDTAGRLHTNTNLMEELKKIKRVLKPDFTVYVGEAITGNDCIEQAELYNDAIGIDGIILTKTDIDERGGTIISVSYVTKKPILFLGTGQEYKDLIEFDKEKIINSLF